MAWHDLYGSRETDLLGTLKIKLHDTVYYHVHSPTLQTTEDFPNNFRSSFHDEIEKDETYIQQVCAV